MKFTLEITLGNDAMQEPTDVSAALIDVAIALSKQGWDGYDKIMDKNGNTVGHWGLDDEG